MEALLGLAAAAFAAATLLPLPSEAALFAYLQAYPDHAFLGVAVASVGNTLGGMTSYLIGRLIPPKNPKGIEMLKRYGAPLTFFAWLPVIGDALPVAAGWLRINWLAVLVCMAAGRLARYIAVAAIA
jgi:membrane protein YqaA with SNARE-associated domain